jgi:hypothetical protein
MKGRRVVLNSEGSTFEALPRSTQRVTEERFLEVAQAIEGCQGQKITTLWKLAETRVRFAPTGFRQNDLEQTIDCEQVSQT